MEEPTISEKAAFKSFTVESYNLAQGEGQSVWFLGTLVTIKATGENTSNAYGLIEQTLPAGFAPPPHVHHSEDEAFYILEGEITFQCGEKTIEAGAGSFVFLPRNIPHGFQVSAGQPARLLQLNSPGGFEHFHVEMGEQAKSLTVPPQGLVDVPKLLTLAEKYNFEVLGPPPGHE